MYNRYVRNDDGVYERIPTPEREVLHDPPPQREAGGGPAPPHDPPREDREPPHRDQSRETAGDRSRDWGPRREDPPPGREKQGLLSGLLGKLKLDGIDSGDLLLLAILFLLFQEGEDEELLIALGLWVTRFYARRVSYICPACHGIFRPRFRQMFALYHTTQTRRLPCPHCGRKGYCVEVANQQEN